MTKQKEEEHRYFKTPKVEKQSTLELRWLTYWVVFSFFHVIEFFSDHLVTLSIIKIPTTFGTYQNISEHIKTYQKIYKGTVDINPSVQSSKRA